MLRWVLTVATVLLLGVWVASGRWMAAYTWVDASGRARAIGVAGGGVLVYALPLPQRLPATARGFRIGQVDEENGSYTLTWRGLWLKQGSAHNILVPLWPAPLLLTGGTVTAWRRRRPKADGLCGKCGYDLRGLKSDDGEKPTCPECGT